MTSQTLLLPPWSPGVDQRAVAARHETAHALAYLWTGIGFDRVEVDGDGGGWCGPDNPRPVSAIDNATVALAGPVVDKLWRTGGGEVETLHSVLDEWRWVQDNADDDDVVEEGGDYFAAGPIGDGSLPMAYAFVVAAAENIDAVAGELLARGSLTRHEVLACLPGERLALSDCFGDCLKRANSILAGWRVAA